MLIVIPVVLDTADDARKVVSQIGEQMRAKYGNAVEVRVEISYYDEKKERKSKAGHCEYTETLHSPECGMPGSIQDNSILGSPWMCEHHYNIIQDLFLSARAARSR